MKVKRAAEKGIAPEIPSVPDSSWDEEESLDQTPPPDHEEWLAVARLGRRATRMRWEMRRRMKVEREAREAQDRLRNGDTDN
jgi:hypothetical protein